ncbi:hypothetical protein D3C72_1604860 [compost metagenome]
MGRHAERQQPLADDLAQVQVDRIAECTGRLADGIGQAQVEDARALRHQSPTRHAQEHRAALPGKLGSRRLEAGMPLVGARHHQRQRRFPQLRDPPAVRGEFEQRQFVLQRIRMRLAGKRGLDEHKRHGAAAVRW